MLYNIPYRTGVMIENDTLLRLAEHPNIVGMKDCCADRAQSIDLLQRRPAGFRVLTGEDAQYHNALVDGADGAILLSAHLETDAFAAVRTMLWEGNQDAAAAQWQAVAELTELLFTEPSPAPAKYWLARTGLIDSAEVRLPMVEVSTELAARLDAEMARDVTRYPREQALWRGGDVSERRSVRLRAVLIALPCAATGRASPVG